MNKVERWIWLSLWPLSIAYFALLISLDPSDPESPAQPLQFIAGYSFLATGLVAWARRPAHRLGKLMVLTGFMYVIHLAFVPVPTLWAVLDASNRFDTVLIPHLLLAYPTGRLIDRPSRWLIRFDYGAIILLSLVYLITDNPRRYFGCPCLPNHLGVVDAQGLHDLTDMLKGIVPGTLALIAVALIIARLVKSTGPERRALAPLWFAAAVTGATFVGYTIFDALPHTIHEGRIADNIMNGLVMSIPISFFVGITRMRFARGAVSDLVVSLGNSPPPAKLRDELARSLGDPSLEVAFPLEGMKEYVDTEGRPVTLPADGSGRAVTFVEREGIRLAALIHDPALTDARDLVNSVAAAASLALDNERLQAEVRAQFQEVRASRARIVEASDEARRRIERDLHDGAQQRLLTLALSLRMAKDQLSGSPDPTARKVLEEAEDEMRLAITELRELAQGIHPAVLTEQGLAAAVEMLAENASVPVLVDIPEERFPSPVEATAYFVVSEALSNVAKYADASRVTVTVRAEMGTLIVEILDDGNGGADPLGGTGLRGLADRVAALDGQMSITSEPGRGTTVRAQIPCH